MPRGRSKNHGAPGPPEARPRPPAPGEEGEGGAQSRACGVEAKAVMVGPASVASRRASAQRLPQRGLLVARVVFLLRRLSRQSRERFIVEVLSQTQKRLMEVYMRSQHQAMVLKETQHSNMGFWPSPSSAWASERRTEVLQVALCDSQERTPEAFCLQVSGKVNTQAALSLGDGPDLGASVMDSRPSCSRALPSLMDHGSAAKPSSYGARARGVSRVHGICRKQYKGRTYYIAKIGFEWLGLRGKPRQGLARAVDDHMVLIAIKQRFFAMGSLPPEERFSMAVLQVLDEHGLMPAELGLSIDVSVPTYHWVGRCLSSPLFSWRDLPDAMRAWQNLRTARGQQGIGGRGLLYRCAPDEVARIWERFRRAYVDIWAERSGNASAALAKLQGLEAMNEKHRRCELERWERSRLQREEQVQLMALRAAAQEAARRLRADLSLASLQEQRERQQMRKEDRTSGKLRAHSERQKGAAGLLAGAELRQRRLLRQLEGLVQRWARQLAMRARQATGRRCREEQRRQRAASLQSARDRRTAQAKARAQRLDWAARRQRMRHRDVTMEEILGTWEADWPQLLPPCNARGQPMTRQASLPNIGLCCEHPWKRNGECR